MNEDVITKKTWQKYVVGGSLAESQKRYYLKNKERILAKHKERYATDMEYRIMFIERVKTCQKKKNLSKLSKLSNPPA